MENLSVDIASITETLHGYIDRGWNIFPVEPNGKRPVVISSGMNGDGTPYENRFKWSIYTEKSGKAQRSTKEQVSRWILEFPDCNWGVVCGRVSNLVVVDIDGTEGIQSVRETHPELEKTSTLIQRSPNGLHMFFAHPGVIVKGFPILHKVDIKADGGYIVVAPSKTASGSYKFATSVAPAQCPGWVVRGERSGKITDPAPPDPSERRPAWVSTLLTHGSASGRRNADAARLVGYFSSHDLKPDVIESILLSWAERCQPPFEQRELRVVIRSVSSYRQMAKARGVVDIPIMTSTGVGWNFSWDALQISIDVSRLVESTRWGVVGEVQVYTSSAAFGISNKNDVYGPIDYAFKSAQAQSQMINALEAKMNGLPWSQIVTDFSRLVVSQFNKGNEWLLLRDAPRAIAHGYAFRPFLLAKEPTLWFSAGGGMKSYLALLLATMMETGMDCGLGPPLVRNHVAYLDWEWDVGQHAKRLDAIISPSDQERLGVNIFYRHCGGRPLRLQIAEIKRMIAEEGITYVIIDSASPACGRASDNDEIVAFFQAISELRVGSLILAHVTKFDRQNADEATATAFGGVQWENQSRSTWNLKKIQEEGSSLAHIVLTHQKVNGGMLHPPVCIRFQFPEENIEEGRIAVSFASPGEISMETSGPSGIPARDQIKMLVRNQPLTIDDIADALPNIPHQTLIGTLRSMESKSLVRTVRSVNGSMTEVWGLRTSAS